MTDGKRALEKLVGISLMIGFMVVGCGQGTQTASNTGEAITSNTGNIRDYNIGRCAEYSSFR